MTSNGASNFAPFSLPDNKRIIFASNMNDPQGRNFDLFLMNGDGSGVEQVTFNAGKKVMNIYDYMGILGELKPGDNISISFQRADKTITVSAIMKSR